MFRFFYQFLQEYSVTISYKNPIKMGKKCVPGLFCIENMTLFLVFVLLIIVAYVYYSVVVKPTILHREGQAPYLQENRSWLTGIGNPTIIPVISTNPANGLAELKMQGSSWLGPFAQPEGRAVPTLVVQAVPPQNAVTKPLTGFGATTTTGLITAIPSISTQGAPDNYSQIGVLTRTSGSESYDILPLMGRRALTNRSNYQYYTFSNNGNISSRLPVRVHGKTCSSDGGCDEISNGDHVHVDGYNDTFQATIYEQEFFSYNPFA